MKDVSAENFGQEHPHECATYSFPHASSRILCPSTSTSQMFEPPRDNPQLKPPTECFGECVQPNKCRISQGTIKSASVFSGNKPANGAHTNAGFELDVSANFKSSQLRQASCFGHWSHTRHFARHNFRHSFQPTRSGTHTYFSSSTHPSETKYRHASEFVLPYKDGADAPNNASFRFLVSLNRFVGVARFRRLPVKLAVIYTKGWRACVFPNSLGTASQDPQLRCGTARGVRVIQTREVNDTATTRITQSTQAFQFVAVFLFFLMTVQ